MRCVRGGGGVDNVGAGGGGGGWGMVLWDAVQWSVL